MAFGYLFVYLVHAGSLEGLAEVDQLIDQTAERPDVGLGGVGLSLPDLWRSVGKSAGASVGESFSESADVEISNFDIAF